MNVFKNYRQKAYRCELLERATFLQRAFYIYLTISFAPKSLQDDKTYQVQADLGLCNMDIKLYICGPTKPP